VLAELKGIQWTTLEVRGHTFRVLTEPTEWQRQIPEALRATLGP
jgi:DNA mismatch repair protein MutH